MSAQFLMATASVRFPHLNPLKVTMVENSLDNGGFEVPVVDKQVFYGNGSAILNPGGGIWFVNAAGGSQVVQYNADNEVSYNVLDDDQSLALKFPEGGIACEIYQAVTVDDPAASYTIAGNAQCASIYDAKPLYYRVQGDAGVVKAETELISTTTTATGFSDTFAGDGTSTQYTIYLYVKATDAPQVVFIDSISLTKV